MLSELLNIEILNMFSSTNGKFVPFFKVEDKNIERTAPLSPLDKKEQLKRLFNCHYYQIFRLCFQVTKDYEIAENLTIQVFVQFYHELDSLDRTIKFKDYLRKLTISNLIDYKRQTDSIVGQKLR